MNPVEIAALVSESAPPNKALQLTSALQPWRAAPPAARFARRGLLPSGGERRWATVPGQRRSQL